MEFYERWHPSMVYTITRKELEKWYEVHGSFAMYAGTMWKPTFKRLFGKFIEVKFKKY